MDWAISDSYDAITPTMPNKQNADYLSWKIWFEKIFPYLNKNKLILVGSSLGGLFLAKYLTENKFPKKINQLHLVCPAFDSSGLIDETVGDFIIDKKNLNKLEKQVDDIYIYHSQDDPVVPVAHSKKYKKFLPKAKLQIFQNRQHFNQPSFIELLNNINKIN